MQIKTKHNLIQLFQCVFLLFAIIFQVSCNTENTSKICNKRDDKNAQAKFNIDENELQYFLGKYYYKSKEGQVILDIKEDGYYKQTAIGRGGTKYESSLNRWEFFNDQPPERRIIFYNFCKLVDYNGDVVFNKSECKKFYATANYPIAKRKKEFIIPIDLDSGFYFSKIKNAK